MNKTYKAVNWNKQDAQIMTAFMKWLAKHITSDNLENDFIWFFCKQNKDAVKLIHSRIGMPGGFFQNFDSYSKEAVTQAYLSGKITEAADFLTLILEDVQ